MMRNRKQDSQQNNGNPESVLREQLLSHVPTLSALAHQTQRPTFEQTQQQDRQQLPGSHGAASHLPQPHHNIDPAIAGPLPPQSAAGGPGQAPIMSHAIDEIDPDEAAQLEADKKAGGKRELSTTKRAAQNRAAQRAFRQRKEGHIKKLEEQVREYGAMMENYKRMQNENYSLREYIINLQSRLLESQGEYPPAPANIDLNGPRDHAHPVPTHGGPTQKQQHQQQQQQQHQQHQHQHQPQHQPQHQHQPHQQHQHQPHQQHQSQQGGPSTTSRQAASHQSATHHGSGPSGPAPAAPMNPTAASALRGIAQGASGQDASMTDRTDPALAGAAAAS